MFNACSRFPACALGLLVNLEPRHWQERGDRSHVGLPPAGVGQRSGYLNIAKVSYHWPRLGPEVRWHRLPRYNKARVSRFVRVRGKASLFDPSLRDNREDRHKQRLVREVGRFHRIQLLQQDGGPVRGGQSGLRSEFEAARQHQRAAATHGAPQPRGALRPVLA
jgi:hypothetical protein